MSARGSACWFVTRERDEGQPLIDALVARGVDARALPCIERRALSWPADLAPSPVGRTVVVVTSAFAAELVRARVAADAWGAVELAAVTPSTAAVFAGAGLPIAISATGGSVALARAVVAAAARAPVARVLYPTSDAGIDAPEQAQALALLSTVTPEVRRAVVYATRPAAGLGDAVRALPAVEPGIGLVFFSPSAVDAFLDAFLDAADRVPGDVVVGAAVCVGASTVRAWDARAPARGGARAIPVDRGDSVADVVAALDRGADSGRQQQASMEVRR